MEKYLTPDEIAESLKLKTSTVWTWLRTGKINGIKIGKEWRVSERDLYEFLEAAKTRKSKEIKSRIIDSRFKEEGLEGVSNFIQARVTNSEADFLKTGIENNSYEKQLDYVVKAEEQEKIKHRKDIEDKKKQKEIEVEFIKKCHFLLMEALNDEIDNFNGKLFLEQFLKLQKEYKCYLTFKQVTNRIKKNLE
ncbi:MAG TPA: helix-turn-helix domain-containing protein [Selenomonadales bacterium]|nr:helix-turn-helix domain-containing protein [Selenomonadales bacterium]